MLQHVQDKQHPAPCHITRSCVEHRISSARSSVSRLRTERRASLFWLEGRARQRTLEGLGQPAQLRCKATPQIDNRVSSCKPRVSVSKVQVLKRQGLQPMADPVSLSAAVLVGELCALGYSYPNIKYYTKKEGFAAFRVVYRGRVKKGQTLLYKINCICCVCIHARTSFPLRRSL